MKTFLNIIIFGTIIGCQFNAGAKPDLQSEDKSWTFYIEHSNGSKIDLNDPKSNVNVSLHKNVKGECFRVPLNNGVSGFLCTFDKRSVLNLAYCPKENTRDKSELIISNDSGDWSKLVVICEK